MIEPRVLKGFRDFLPELMIQKKKIIHGLENIFEKFGFVPIDTPALEYTEILLGKGSGETDKLIYRFNDHGGRDVALRYDLTVPLARYVSEHFNEMVFPFKRYHIGPVWRGENTSKGRFREFYQCDFDILGTESVNADIEILLVIKNGLDAIFDGGYLININNRQILNSFLSGLGVYDKSADILRIIDKIYKIGTENVIKELDAAGINGEVSKKLVDFLNLSDEKKSAFTGVDIFTAIDKIKSTIGETDAVKSLEHIFNTLKLMGLPEFFAFNPAITRGLDYYTGIVFETFITDNMEFGSVCSGGRYDNLTGLYSKNIIKGVGASFGLDRLISLLEFKNALPLTPTNTGLLIFNMDENLNADYQTLADYFRKNGINTEVTFEKQKIGNQFKFAEKKHIKHVLIAGEEEFKSGKFNLKNIITAVEKKSLTRESILEEIFKDK
jgi:histidyl-tRNA synthetase